MTNEEFIASYGHRASMSIVDGRVVVRGSLDLRGCTGLTALPDGLTVGGSLDLRGCTGLTALPDGLTVGGSLYLNGCTGLTDWAGAPFLWRVVDGYSMRLRGRGRTIDGCTVTKAEWLSNIAPGRDLEQCYIAEQGEYAAHGDTIANAIRDLRFKIAQANFDAGELAEEIARRGTVTKQDFRLIAGACEAGLRVGMADAGLDPDAEELPLDVVLAKAHGSFGDAFRDATEGVSA